jgi:hypothetical protein
MNAVNTITKKTNEKCVHRTQIPLLPTICIEIAANNILQLVGWFGLWCLTPHSTIFQLLYRSSQF